MWCLIRPDDFVFLINNYDNIKFESFTVNDNLVTIDKKIRVFFKHYKSGTQKTPTKIGIDVFTNNVVEYVKKKYSDRVKRMKHQTPVFIIIVKDEIRPGDSFDEYSFTDISLLKQIKSKYKILVVTRQNLNNMKLDKNIKVVNVKTTRAPTVEIASQLLKGKYI